MIMEKWRSVATLTIAQAEILLHVSSEKFTAAGWVRAKPLAKLIRKGLVTLEDRSDSDQHAIVTTPKGREWLARAAAVQKAYGAYVEATEKAEA
jgi:hypothetical protein